MPIWFVLFGAFNLSCQQIRFLVIHFLHCVLIVACESKIERMWKYLLPLPFALSPLPVERSPLICIYLFICLFIYVEDFYKSKTKTVARVYVYPG